MRDTKREANDNRKKQENRQYTENIKKISWKNKKLNDDDDCI